MAFKVSVCAVSHSTNVCTRYNFDPSTLTPGSTDPIGTFQAVSRWLHGVNTS